MSILESLIKDYVRSIIKEAHDISDEDYREIELEASVEISEYEDAGLQRPGPWERKLLNYLKDRELIPKSGKPRNPALEKNKSKENIKQTKLLKDLE